MRIDNARILRHMEKDLSRWLYPALDLSDPLRATGISCYAADADEPLADFVMIADLADGVTVRSFTQDRGVIAEALSDPAVEVGTQVRFCAGIPEDWRGADMLICGEHALHPDSFTRTLDRYGLYGVRSSVADAAPSPDFTVRAPDPDAVSALAALDPDEWGGLPSRLADFADGDGMLLACADDGQPAGYLWYAAAGARFYDIVNLFVRPEFRRRGAGRSLVLRYCTEARIRGRLAYYGCAASRESALLAQRLGFERIYAAPVIFTVEPAGALGINLRAGGNSNDNMIPDPKGCFS